MQTVVNGLDESGLPSAPRTTRIEIEALLTFHAVGFPTLPPRRAARRAALHGRQLMARGGAVPKVRQRATLMDATVQMSGRRFGCTAVVDDKDRLLGAFTDGDLRRRYAKPHLKPDIHQHMTASALSIAPDQLTSNERPIRVFHLHDILRAGVA